MDELGHHLGAAFNCLDEEIPELNAKALNSPEHLNTPLFL